MFAAKRLTSVLLALSLATTSFTPLYAAPRKAPAAAAALTAAAPEAVGFSSERLKRLDAAMAKTVADGEVVGMTTLLMRHGKTVAFNTYGELAPGKPMSKDALFRIYSMTKPITGVAMMILFEEGKWRLDDPVTKFVPEFRDLKVMTGLGVNGQPILVPMKRPPTMREIMSHTAGLGYGLSDYHYVDKQFRDKQVLASQGLKQFIDRTATIPLMFQPGENWSYSVAVDVQGAIVERITGKTLGQFMAERIFTPLKMTDTFFQVPADKAARLGPVYVFDAQAGKLIEAKRLFGMADVPDYTKPPSMESGGGGLVSSTTDYARFCAMLANGGQLDGVRIISPSTVKLMGTNVIPRNVLVGTDGRGANAVQQFNENVGFGLDFMVLNDAKKSGSLEGDGTMSWGGAAGTWFWVDPENDIVFVGMIQRFAGAPTALNVSGVSRTMVYSALVDPAK
ncbi:MAG: beta-lactamase [Caulobacteraceae bacterium]|nr:beta-lactamase [Caulobacteraceae bacterium]